MKYRSVFNKVLKGFLAFAEQKCLNAFIHLTILFEEKVCYLNFLKHDFWRFLNSSFMMGKYLNCRGSPHLNKFMLLSFSNCLS